MWFITSQKNGAHGVRAPEGIGLGSEPRDCSALGCTSCGARWCVQGVDTLEWRRSKLDESWTSAARRLVTLWPGAETKAIIRCGGRKERARDRSYPLCAASQTYPRHTPIRLSGTSLCLGRRPTPDGWRGYNGLVSAIHRCHVSVISDSPDPAHEVMPRVQLKASPSN